MPISNIIQQAPACGPALPVILYADDDIDDRNFFAEALALTFHPVTLVMVKNGEELIEYLQVSAKPQVVFLDMNMPRKNGAQCLAEIRANPLLSGLPVVIISTFMNEARRNQLIEEGAAYCFSKPAEFTGLVSLLKKTVQLILYASPLSATP